MRPCSDNVTMPPNDVLTEPNQILHELFGFREFRFGQQDAVDAVMQNRDAVVLLPTGGGKSLCYQVPAVAFRRQGKGTTVVISPLIALMQDQVAALSGRGIAAAAMNSHQDDEQRRDVSAQFLKGELDLLYVSPERAALEGFRRMLRKVPVALLAIDEAHCVSQWGHDFRPEYMRLGELRELFSGPTIALTATATPRVMTEIVAQLQMRNPTLVKGDFTRANLAFSVQHLRGDEARLDALIAALDEAGMRSRKGEHGRAIIYCATRKKAEDVAKKLKSANVPCSHYHAGRTQLARSRAQNAFEAGRSKVLVATNAFGMGIDYPDVRLIVHFQSPASLEAYYQEAGRAGRDGEPGKCLLFFGPGDLMTQRRIAEMGPRSEAQRLRGEAALVDVQRYVDSEICRQVVLCSHFTATDDHPRCGRCDVCTGAIVAQDAHPAQKPLVAAVALNGDIRTTITAAVSGLRRPVGKTNLVRALRGSQARPLRRLGLLDMREHGALHAHNERDLVATVDDMLKEGQLARKGRKYPTVWPAGKPVRAVRAPGEIPAPRRTNTMRFGGLRHTDCSRELENYRRRTARALKWKSYMVFQQRTIADIEEKKPVTRDDLIRIRGLGPAKIEKFGEDILEIVRRYYGA